MPAIADEIARLKDLQRSLLGPFIAAQRANDTEKMRALEALNVEIDLVIDQLTLGTLRDAAAEVARMAAKVTGVVSGAGTVTDDDIAPFAHAGDADTGDGAPPAAIAAGASAGTDDYLALWKTAEVRPEWAGIASDRARAMVANQPRYAAAVAGSDVPWWFVAVIHSLECGLRFDRHLHNGDPLTGRTVRHPPGRPLAGMPPFTWEDSARDALAMEGLFEHKDWSLGGALARWHRYNGVANEYRRRGIPTPYLWSGTQHYVKGLYVRDHVFDPEKVSRQPGAATLLKALIGIGAVSLDRKTVLRGALEAAIGQPDLLGQSFSGKEFKHLETELAFPGALQPGDGKRKSRKQELAVRRLQEWLTLNGAPTLVDGDFGGSTARMLARFQQQAGRPVSDTLEPDVWALLTAPLRRALAPIGHPDGTALEDAVVAVGLQHVAQAPIEVGGPNAGPWVRAYMRGADGPDQLWCAGFACFVVAQAARDLGREMPFPRQVGCDALAADAKMGGRFIPEASMTTASQRLSKLRPGMLFVQRSASNDADFNHAGILLKPLGDTFDTLEGNTSVDGDRNGLVARQGNRAYRRRDFLALF